MTTQQKRERLAGLNACVMMGLPLSREREEEMRRLAEELKKANEVNK